MDTDDNFKKIITDIYGKRIENYNIDVLYKIYNVIKYSNIEDPIFVYNKIIKILIIDDYSFSKIHKDRQLLLDIYSYLQILKYDKNYELHIKYYKYKSINFDYYMELLDYKDKLITEDPYVLYKQLWEKFLDFKNDKIIERKLKYYIEKYENEEELNIINHEIITEYINTFNIKTIDKTYDKTELFFLLLNNNL